MSGTANSGAPSRSSPGQTATRPPVASSGAAAEDKTTSKVPPAPPASGGTASRARSAEATAAQSGRPPASRRAQGWHTAVDGGAGVGPKTASILSSNTSSLGRRHSVQFSEDTLLDTPSARAQAHGARSKEDAAFRLNMVDFLGVMYGDKADGASATSVVPASAGSSGAGGGATSGPSARASMYRSAATAPQAQPPSPSNAGGKGPQIKGKTAATAVPLGRQGNSSGRGAGIASGSSGRSGDGIDMLVEHLVRAYSSRMNMAAERGGLMGMDDGAEMPISYNSGRTKGPVTGRRAAPDASEVSTFVSHALDSFFTPATQRGANQLTSTKSILSSLGLDQNFARLLSFKTNSNLPPDQDNDDESTDLKPVHIGEQALFRSVDSRTADVSVSKSMSVMRGVIPPVPYEEGSAAASKGPSRNSADSLNGKKSAASSGSSNGQAVLEASLNSAEVRQPAKGSGGRRAVTVTTARVASLNNEKSFTLDSKALLSADGGADDSWGDVDAEAAEAAKAERETKKKASGQTDGGTLVKGARSLLELAKDRTAIQDLVEQETLSRNVVMALEQQFRGYVASAMADAKTPGDARVRRRASDSNSNTVTHAGVAAAAKK